MNMFQYARPKISGTFMLAVSLLMWVPFIILGAAIDWPGSLSEPASVVLPQLIEKSSEVTLGYVFYLLYSVLFFPMAYLFSRFAQGNEKPSILADIAIGFAALSTLARVFGIARWLTMMPVLASAWGMGDQAEVALIYDAMNAYAGGVGEIIGVGIFAGTWGILTCVLAAKRRALPKWLSVSGIISACIVLFPAVELFGMEIGGLISVSTGVIHIWWLAAGGYLLTWKAGQPAAVNR